MIGWVVVKVKDPGRSADIARNIDDRVPQFLRPRPRPRPRRPSSRASRIRWATSASCSPFVAAAVFFTMLLVTANTMGQSIRERINEIGVMKTLGFSGAGVTLLDYR